MAFNRKSNSRMMFLGEVDSTCLLSCDIIAGGIASCCLVEMAEKRLQEDQPNAKEIGGSSLSCSSCRSMTTDVTSGGGLSGSIGTAVRPITAVRCLLGFQSTGSWNGNGSIGCAQSNDHGPASCVGLKISDYFWESCQVGHFL